jgi:hypothetical protein
VGHVAHMTVMRTASRFFMRNGRMIRILNKWGEGLDPSDFG